MKTNIIHPSFKHGISFEIGNFCIIEEDVVVGDNVKIENYVLLKSGTVIGDNTFIDSYVRSSGDNLIGNDCTIRYGATIAKEVEIHNEVFISPNVMTIYSDPKGTSNKTISMHTVIHNGVYIGTSAIIGKCVEIYSDITVGAMSYVKESLFISGTYVGVPAKLL